jgi:hypothetical protein
LTGGASGSSVANPLKGSSRDAARAEVPEISRELIEEVRLVPEKEKLRGDLAAILSFAQKTIPAPEAPG